MRYGYPPPSDSTWEGAYQDDHLTVQVGPERLLSSPSAGLRDETINAKAPPAYTKAGS